MIKRYRIVFRVVLVLIALTAGCAYPSIIDEDQGWSLSGVGSDERRNGTFVFNGEVYLGGHYEGVEVGGVWVHFVDGDNRTIKKVPLDELNVSQAEANVTVDLDREPKYVLVFVESVTIDNESASRPQDIIGLKRTQDYYSPYLDYDPYLSDRTASS